MSPNLVGVSFFSLWTACTVACFFLSWSRLRKARAARTQKIWFNEIDEATFPKFFALLCFADVLGMIGGAIFSAVGVAMIAWQFGN